MRAVVAIERYRVEHDITDNRSAVGPEPSTYVDALGWYRVNDIVLNARQTIVPPAPTVAREVPSVHGRSLDIGL